MKKQNSKTKAAITSNGVLAAGITKEKAQVIYDKVYKIAMLINDIECDLQGTDLKYKLLVPDKNAPTLWSQFYELEKVFKDACC